MAEWYPIVSQLSYQFICWWTFGCCHLLATVDSAAMNIHVKYIFESLFSVFRHMYLLVELLVMRRLCFLQGMPVPSHVHHPANPFVVLSFGFLQEASLDAPPVFSQSLHSTPLSKQFRLYMVTTQFLLSPSVCCMVQRAGTVSYSGPLTSISTFLAHPKCSEMTCWMTGSLGEWMNFIDSFTPRSYFFPPDIL